MRGSVSNFASQNGQWPELQAPATAIESFLDQLGVKQNLGVVGKQL
jgi:hypothetical protein